MTTRHWLKSYGDTPAEINADRYTSVVDMLEGAMQRYRRAAGVSLLRPDADLCRCRPAVARLLRLPAAELGVKKGDRIAVMSPNFAGLPGRLPGHRPRRRGAGERQPAVHAARARASAQRRRLPRPSSSSAASTPVLAEIIGKTAHQDRHHRRPGRRQRRGAAQPAGGCAAAGAPCRLRDALDIGRRQAAVTPVALTRPTTCVPAIHRRHHRAVARAPRCRTATWSPTPSSSRPSCPTPCARARKSSSRRFRCITSSR